jgi:hypothetical protein
MVLTSIPGNSSPGALLPGASGIEDPSRAALIASSTLSAAAAVQRPAESALSVATSLSATPTVHRSGAATLSTAGSQISAAAVTYVGAASLTGTATMSATGTGGSHLGSAALTCTGTVTPRAATTVVGISALSSSATVAVNGVLTLTGKSGSDYGVAPTFTRSSIAYDSKGNQVSSGVPRFEPGYDAATNLLTENQSNVETSAFGTVRGSGTTTITRTTVESWEGVASLSVAMDGSAATQGVNLTSSGTYPVVSPNRTYTASMWIKGPAGSSIRLGLAERTAAGTFVAETQGSLVAMTGEWQRLSVTRLFGATGERAQIYAEKNQLGAVTIFIDGLQLETSSIPTGWLLGGTSRAGGQAVMVEEGTTNLLSASRSRSDTLADWTFYGTNAPEIVDAPAGYSWAGGKAVKITYQDDNRLLGHTLTLTAAAHAIACYVWVPSSFSGASLTITDDGAFAGATDKVIGTADLSKRDQWQRIVLTLTPVSGDLTGALVVRGTSMSAGNHVFVGGFQVEAKAYATSWQVGGTARITEKLSIPPPSSDEGTVEIVVDVTPQLFANIGTQVVFQARTAAQGNAFWLYKTSGGATWSVQRRKEDNSLQTSTIPSSLTPVGRHRFALKWKRTGAETADIHLYVDGALQLTMLGSMWTSASFTESTVGSYITSGSNINTSVDDLRVSSTAHSDAKILADYSSGVPLAKENDTTYLRSFDGALNLPGIYGTSSLAASSAITLGAQAGLVTSGSTVSAAAISYVGKATLSATASVTPSGVVNLVGQTNLTGSASTSATGSHIWAGSAIVTGTAVITGEGAFYFPPSVETINSDAVNDRWIETGMVLDQPIITYDLEQLRNVVEVRGHKGEGCEQTKHIAYADRKHPLSPWSLARNGEPRYLVELVENGQIKRKTSAREKAERILRRHLRAAVQVEFSCLPVPHLEENDVCTLIVDNGATTLRINEFHVKSFSIPLTAEGVMTVGTLKRRRKPLFRRRSRK